MGGFSLRFLDKQMMSLAVLAWVAALFLTVGAMSALLTAVRGGIELNAAEAAVMPVVNKQETPVQDPELKKLTEKIQILHPALKLTVQGGQIKLTASRGEQYSDWTAAIADLMQSGDRSLIFETESLCGAKCEGGDFYAAVFKAKRLTFSVN